MRQLTAFGCPCRFTAETADADSILRFMNATTNRRNEAVWRINAPARKQSSALASVSRQAAVPHAAEAVAMASHRPVPSAPAKKVLAPATTAVTSLIARLPNYGELLGAMSPQAKLASAVALTGLALASLVAKDAARSGSRAAGSAAAAAAQTDAIPQSEAAASKSDVQLAVDLTKGLVVLLVQLVEIKYKSLVADLRAVMSSMLPKQTPTTSNPTASELAGSVGASEAPSSAPAAAQPLAVSSSTSQPPAAPVEVPEDVPDFSAMAQELDALQADLSEDMAEGSELHSSNLQVAHRAEISLKLSVYLTLA